jgi:NAD(P)-dependent dehydrogenase (short-subunit alcohol dehydrogenase family)
VGAGSWRAVGIITEWAFIFRLTLVNERLLSPADVPEVLMVAPSSSGSSSYQPPDLKGRVTLVAGATRGVGRGAALALGEAGATVYCTGRSTRANRVPRNGAKKASPFDHARRPETIEETAEMVSARGGHGIAAVVDHTDAKKVEELIERIRSEQGKLHVVVNDISELTPADFGKTFWQINLENGFANFRNVVHSHIITSRYAAPLLIETAKKESFCGLIVEIGDGDSYTYRGHLFYDLVKNDGDPAGVCNGAGAATEECGGRGAHAGLSAVGGDAGAFWRHGGELARRDQERCELRQFGDALVCGPGDRGAGGGRQPDEKVRARVQFVESV